MTLMRACAYLLIFVCLFCTPALGLEKAGGVKTIDVTRRDDVYVKEPLVANDKSQAKANTRRIHAIMSAAPAGAAIHFPAGDYYFHGSLLPNHGTVETSQPGQIIYGDGADVTNLIQTDTRKDFGFTCSPKRKRVPAATVRVRHKGSRVRNLSVLVDPDLPLFTILPSAAVQLANIKYYPDNNIGILETTGTGTDFLLDYVNVHGVNVGRNLGPGIQSTHFFEVGVDIVGTSGEIKVFDTDRLDAKTGIRLDNGNHCGQGGYYFENIAMTGRHKVTDGGVFLDWIGGQAPFVRNCSALFISGIHAGPLGINGDRLEPNQEGSVLRRRDKTWDWFTVQACDMPDEPDAAQRSQWYGLARRATVTRIASEPRTGGTVWVEGKDYTLETITEPGDMQYAVKIHWKTQGPPPGSMYYVEYNQPVEYRVHDIEWGYVMNCQLGEALQSGKDAFAMKIEDQGFGYKNPDFRFGVGYGFFITNNFVLNGPFIFDGRVDYVNINGNTTGVCDFKVNGRGLDRQASRLNFSHNQLNNLLVGDYVSCITADDNDVGGSIKIDAPSFAEHITITGNTVTSGASSAVEVSGKKVIGVRIKDNDIRSNGGDGIVLKNVLDVMISGNNVSGCPGSGIVLTGCDTFNLHDNIASRNGKNGIKCQAASTASGRIHDNICVQNKAEGIVAADDSGQMPAGITIKDNTVSDVPESR